MRQTIGPVAELIKVRKRYGNRWALQDVDLRLNPGDIVGFIGPNGAGKSTLMKCMAGLIRPTDGELTVLGQRLHEKRGYGRTPDGLGFCTDQIGFISYLSGYKNLLLLARIRAVAGPAEVGAALQRVGLDAGDNRPVSTYSTGMRQRLNVAQALMESPRLLLLDEPTNGLDPAGVVAFRSLLSEVAAQGTAILLASHLLTEVERVCNRVILVRAGRILRELSLQQAGVSIRRLQVSTVEDQAQVGAWLAARRIPAVPLMSSTLIGGHPFGFDIESPMPIPELVRELVALSVSIEAIAPVQSVLESEYLRVIGEAS